jgi:hypothetical protein
LETNKIWKLKWGILLSVITLSTGVLGGYALQSTSLPLEVKDPLEILDYPSALSIFPGQTIEFNVTIRNIAPVTYNISLGVTLNDTVYQARYIRVSNSVYTVAPGDAILTTLLEVSSSAPPAQLTLTVETNRQGQPYPSLPTSTFSPSLTLVGAGARWAARNGTSALYVNWFDNFNAHYYTDGADWGPWWAKADLEKMKSNMVEILELQGFTVECSAEVPENLSKYDLVIFEAWFAVEPKHNSLVRDYISHGGSVVVMQEVPCFFAAYCKDMWPYRVGGTDLSSLQDWFGSRHFANTGGKASLARDNPFGTSLLSQDYFFYGEGHSCYGLVPSSLSNDSRVIALWNDGTVFAFTHEYGEGRVYFQAVAE